MEMEKGVAIFFILLLPPLLCCQAIMLRRRRTYPVLHRLPRLVVAANILLCVEVIYYSIQTLISVRVCIPLLWLSGLVETSIIGIYVLRIFNIYARFKVQQDHMKLAERTGASRGLLLAESIKNIHPATDRLPLYMANLAPQLSGRVEILPGRDSEKSQPNEIKKPAEPEKKNDDKEEKNDNVDHGNQDVDPQPIIDSTVAWQQEQQQQQHQQQQQQQQERKPSHFVDRSEDGHEDGHTDQEIECNPKSKNTVTSLGRFARNDSSDDHGSPNATPLATPLATGVAGLLAGTHSSVSAASIVQQEARNNNRRQLSSQEEIQEEDHKSMFNFRQDDDDDNGNGNSNGNSAGRVSGAPPPPPPPIPPPAPAPLGDDLAEGNNDSESSNNNSPHNSANKHSDKQSDNKHSDNKHSLKDEDGGRFVSTAVAQEAEQATAASVFTPPSLMSRALAVTGWWARHRNLAQRRWITIALFLQEVVTAAFLAAVTRSEVEHPAVLNPGRHCWDSFSKPGISSRVFLGWYTLLWVLLVLCGVAFRETASGLKIKVDLYICITIGVATVGVFVGAPPSIGDLFRFQISPILIIAVSTFYPLYFSYRVDVRYPDHVKMSDVVLEARAYHHRKKTGGAAGSIFSKNNNNLSGVKNNSPSHTPVHSRGNSGTSVDVVDLTSGGTGTHQQSAEQKFTFGFRPGSGKIKHNRHSSDVSSMTPKQSVQMGVRYSSRRPSESSKRGRVFTQDEDQGGGEGGGGGGEKSGKSPPGGVRRQEIDTGALALAGHTGSALLLHQDSDLMLGERAHGSGGGGGGGGGSHHHNHHNQHHHHPHHQAGKLSHGSPVLKPAISSGGGDNGHKPVLKMRREPTATHLPGVGAGGGGAGGSPPGPEEKNMAFFKKFISTPEGFVQFKEFLEAEFSVENLLFVSAVRRFLDFTTSDSAVTALLIFDTFIASSSPMQVNLAAKTYSKMCYQAGLLRAAKDSAEHLESVRSLYRIASSEIYQLMQKDSWHRFCAQRLNL